MSKITKSDKIIAFIKESPNGRRFSEIQRFIVEELNGLNYDERETCNTERTAHMKTLPRRYRGYWCTRLTGGRYYGNGMLINRGCVKVLTGTQTRWIYKGQ
jgi:hypothetical protein